MSKELLHMIVFATILYVHVQCFPSVEGARALDHRSTESFKSLFIEKCQRFPKLYKVDEFKSKDCSHLWDLFFKGFANKPRCRVPENSYEQFINAAYHSTPRNKHIFWSGVYEFVSRYTNKGKKRTAIADTLTGYLPDNLNWCGNKNSKDGNEVNVASCPPCNSTLECPMPACVAFWAKASINFAKDAKGSIEIMLNSSQSPAFREKSILATKELPHLKRTVTSARVILVHSLGAVPKENCKSTSVSTLTRNLTLRGIRTDCVERSDEALLQTSGAGSQDFVPRFIAILAFLFTSL